MKTKSNARCNKCKDHQFEMTPLHQNLHHMSKVQVSFCDCTAKNLRKKEKGSIRKCCSGYAVLNKDQNHATPAFILQNQKQHFLENKEFYIKDHARKIKQFQYEAAQIYYPVPRSTNDYCNVCCASFSDYIQHIGSIEHHRQVSMSRFNGFILQLQRNFKDSRTQKTGKRTIEQRCIEIEDDSDLSNSGHKKIKTDERTQISANIPILVQKLAPEFQNPYEFNNHTHLNQMRNNLNHNSFDRNALYKSIHPNTEETQNHFKYWQYCRQHQNNPLMYNNYYGSNVVPIAKQQQANAYNYFPNRYNNLMGPTNYYQQNHQQIYGIENGLERLPREQCFHYSMPYYQSPYFCFNNFNQYVFTW